MVLDVVDAIFEVAVALGQVDLQQVTQEVLQVRAEVRRETHLKHTRHGIESWSATCDQLYTAVAAILN